MKTLRPMWLLTSLLASAAVFAQSEPPPPAPVEVDVATRNELAPVLWTPASVVSRNDARIAAEQDGRVVFLAEIGTRVPAGGVLARLDDRLLRLDLEEARAARGRVAAQLDYARSQEQRLAQLAKQATVSHAQADEAASERRMLEQTLRGADVAIRQAELRLGRTTLRAPFAGMVAERLIAVGEYLNTGTSVVRLVDTVEVEVQARAPVGLAGFVSEGSQVSLRYAGSEQIQSVRAVVPVGDASTRQFELRIALGAGQWPIGAALEVGLPSATPRQVVTVPRDAVVLRPGERFVIRVADDGTAERVHVTTGGSIADRVEVSGDIVAGDRLVVRGAERLQSGQRLQIAALPTDGNGIAGAH